MKKLIVIILIILLSVVVFAQNNELKNGLGFALGRGSGKGFSYIHKFSKTAYQITLGILSVNIENDCSPTEHEIYEEYMSGTIDTLETRTQKCKERYTSSNVGLQYLWYINKGKKSSLFLTFETAVYYTLINYKNQKYKIRDQSRNSIDVVKVGDSYKEIETDYTINPGIGIGVEAQITNNIMGTIALPFTYSSKTKNFMTIPQISLIYYFK